MLKREFDGIEWLEFELLADIPTIKHAVITRKGGFSQGSFDSLNLGLRIGDDDSVVQRNIDKVSEKLNFPSIIKARCHHGSQVACVTSHTPTDSLECDSIVTDVEGISLLTTHADCQAALFYDPIKHVAASVHSGWRGSVANIYLNTVLFLKERYHCSPENLLVGISPSLGPEHAEFKNYAVELPGYFLQYRIGDCHFNFLEISRAQLESAGVLADHIQIAGICTYQNENDFFSYRRDHKTGRNGSLITLL